jgi:hypothetical protein
MNQPSQTSQQFSVKIPRDSSVASAPSDIKKVPSGHSERNEESQGFVNSPRIAANEHNGLTAVTTGDKIS